MLAGCGKEETPATVADEAADVPAKKVVEESSTEAGDMASSLMESGKEVVEDAVEVAKAKVAEIDFTKLTWDDVTSVPFDEKMQLASWATSQADAWKGQLMDAAKSQGMGMLSNLGDSGWQGALKKVVDAIEAVRKSSPETYELARGALISAWGTFEKQANAILNP